jgi:hypothetical protein
MSNSGSDFYDTIVGELTLLDGRRQSDAAHIAVLTPPRRANADRRHETIFIFLDLGGGGSGGLARAMLRHFVQIYWRCSGAVTSALRQAFNAANAHMLEENRLLPVSQRRRGGMVCAVLREDNLYLAQIGPASALLSQGDQVVRFPDESRDEFGPAAQPEGLPLGVSSGLDIRFTHQYLNAGDRFLLTGESWSENLPENALSAALGHGGAEEALLALERQAGTGVASALIVECVSQNAQVTAPAMDRLDEEIRPFHRTPLDDGAEVPPEPRWRPASPLAGGIAGRAQLAQVRHALQQAGESLGDGARTLLTRVLPEPEPDSHWQQRRARRAKKQNVPMMAGFAVAIPLLVAFVVVTFYLQRSANARRQSLADKAREAVQTARDAVPADAHALWESALVAAQEALSAASDDDELLAMHAEARETLDALDGVLRPELTQLWNFGPGESRRLAAARLQLYVLDTVQREVTQHLLDQAREDASGDEPKLVAYQGESVGNEQIGGLHDIVWLEADEAWSSDALLILTSDNQLLQYNLSWGLSWVPLDTGLARVNIRLLEPYKGRLYALDPEQSQVWRIPASGDGFGPPEGYFPAGTPDLSTAIDMTIDGSVYILLEDGRILKFLGGEEQPYQLGDLPESLIHPVALASEGDAEDGALYVADAGAQSIVAVTKDGEFIHQIKAEGDALAGLEALTIEKRNRTLFALAGGRLYAVALPPLPVQSDAAD